MCRGKERCIHCKGLSSVTMQHLPYQVLSSTRIARNRGGFVRGVGLYSGKRWFTTNEYQETVRNNIPEISWDVPIVHENESTCVFPAE